MGGSTRDHEADATVSELNQVLADRVQEWRTSGYPCAPVIGEILEYAIENEREGRAGLS